MGYKYLAVERDGHITTVTLNRPEKANALNYGLIEEIENLALSFREDFECRVVIFTGAGKHFCSGFDLTDPSVEYQGPTLQRLRRNRVGVRATIALYNMDQITIAAWNGAAMGGGAVIATALDFRIGAESCVMRYPEVDLGLNLSWNSLPLIVHLVGPARAKRLVVGGEQIDSTTLLNWGVLDELVADDDLLDHARSFAEIYASKPPIAAQMIKTSINRVASALDASVMHMDADQNLLTQTTADKHEAVRAYLAKEKPEFIGD